MWFSFHSDCHRSAAAFSCSLHCPNIPPCCEDLTDASVPLYPGCRLSVFIPLLLPLSCQVFNRSVIFLFSGQGLLPTFNWCSERTSATEDVFLMHHPWRDVLHTHLLLQHLTYGCVLLEFGLLIFLLEDFCIKIHQTITFLFFFMLSLFV